MRFIAILARPLDLCCSSIAQDGRGNTVVLPPGRYRVAAQNNKPYALLISKNVQLQGTGGPPYSASVLLLSGTSDALLVEGVPARGTVIRNFNDGTLGGGTWIGCYSETSAIGFTCSSPGAPVFVGCFTEDTTGGDFGGGMGALVVGGSLLSRSNALQGVGVLRSRLQFSAQTGTPAVTYGANIPAAAHNAALEFWRNDVNSSWSLAYTADRPGTGSAPYPYLSDSWRWRRTPEAAVQPDPYGAPYGWTDAGNPRGVALPFIANPLLNTIRRWSWKQTGITLRPGKNVVYLSGGKHQRDQRPSGTNVVVATLVWHFEAYVTNGLAIG